MSSLSTTTVFVLWLVSSLVSPKPVAPRLRGGWRPLLEAHLAQGQPIPRAPDFHLNGETAHPPFSLVPTDPAPEHDWQATQSALVPPYHALQNHQHPIKGHVLPQNVQLPVASVPTFQSESHLQQPVNWDSVPSSPSPSSEFDQATLDALMKALSQDQHEAVPVTSSIELHSIPNQQAKPSKRLGRSRRRGPWTEESMKRWSDLRFRYFKTEPEFLRQIPYFFPNEAWLKRSKLVIWEERGIRDVINIRAFNGELRWVDLKDLPGMRDTLRQKSPVYKPSRVLPYVTLPATALPPTSTYQGSYRVFITDHGYRGRAKETKVVGSILEDLPHWAVWIMPSMPHESKFPMYFVGLGYLGPNHVAALPRLMRKQAASLEQGVLHHL